MWGWHINKRNKASVIAMVKIADTIFYQAPTYPSPIQPGNGFGVGVHKSGFLNGGSGNGGFAFLQFTDAKIAPDYFLFYEINKFKVRKYKKGMMFLLEFLTSCQLFNNFFQTLFSGFLFLCGLKSKSNGKKIGLIERLKKFFGFFIFAKFF